MLDLNVLEVLAAVLLYLAVPALLLLAAYWITRLAVRHEARRTAATRVNQAP